MGKKCSAKISFKGACTAVGGKGWRGDLLARILYWWPKAELVHHEKLWIAHSRQDWMKEIHCTSLRTLDRAMTDLKRAELIETSQKYFGGYWIQHVRPTDECLTAVETVYGAKLEQPWEGYLAPETETHNISPQE